jgi:hypothetical protein
LTGVVAEPGTNAFSNKGAVWIGPGGTYTKTFNNASEDLIFIIWAPTLRGSMLTSPSSHLTSPSAHMNHECFVDICQEVKLRVSFCEFAQPGNEATGRFFGFH